MNLIDVIEVHETYDSGVINELLHEGWRIIGSYVDSDEKLTRYTLGRTEEVTYRPDWMFKSL